MEEKKNNVENIEQEKKNCKCGDACKCHEENEDHKCHCDEHKKEHHKDHKKDQSYKEKINMLEEENKSLTEKIKISQAELINYRKRKDEETANSLKYANQDLIIELISLVDNFERAIKLDDNDLTDELSKFLDGFKMMYVNLTEILKRFGVSEINRIGETFDPTLEQALMTDNIKDMEDDIVSEVLLKGYKLKDRVIRPASVKINKKEI